MYHHHHRVWIIAPFSRYEKLLKIDFVIWIFSLFIQNTIFLFCLSNDLQNTWILCCTLILPSLSHHLAMTALEHKYFMMKWSQRRKCMTETYLVLNSEFFLSCFVILNTTCKIFWQSRNSHNIYCQRLGVSWMNFILSFLGKRGTLNFNILIEFLSVIRNCRQSHCEFFNHSLRQIWHLWTLLLATTINPSIT